MLRKVGLTFCVLFLVARGAFASPLVIGDTFALHSTFLHEERRINVYAAPGSIGPGSAALPVLYMPDGGIEEDFLHVAGLVQVLVGNGSMRPVLLVGIQNTERRRDLTPPTENSEDRKIAARVGGSANFRAFMRDELMPEIRKRYRTSDEAAIVGESLAGLFVIETLLVAPNMFDTYIAIDPSLWWNEGHLLAVARAMPRAPPRGDKALFMVTSGTPTMAESCIDLGNAVGAAGVRWVHQAMPAESHGTIYHPGALQVFRTAFTRRSLPAR